MKLIFTLWGVDGNSVIGDEAVLKIFGMFLFLLMLPMLGLPLGDFIHNVVNRTSSMGHDLLYNIEQFRTYPGRILTPLNKGELKICLGFVVQFSVIFLNKLCHFQ